MASRYEITDAVMKTVNLGGAVSVFQAGAGASAQIKDLQGNNLTVYQAETGATTVANPLTVDSAGRIEGWVEAPDFKVTISGTGITTYTQEIRQSPAGTFNVKSYGAKGDGSNDDTAAIQAAFTAAGSTGIVTFPPGTYKLTAAITLASGVTVQGAFGAVIDVAANLNGFEGTSLSNITIQGLKFLGNGGTTDTADAIELTTCTRIRITGCHFEAFAAPNGGGAVFSGCSEIVFANNTGLDSGYALCNFFNCNGFTAVGNVHENTRAVSLLSTCIYANTGSVDGTITANTSINDTWPFEVRVAAKRITLTGNTIKGCKNQAITVQSTAANQVKEVIVSSNIIELATGATDGIFVDSTIDCTVIGNLVTGPATNAGIWVTRAGAGADGTDNLVSGNTVKGSAEYGILVAASCVRNAIIGNRIETTADQRSISVLANDCLISNNFIYDSGWHGIDVTGNDCQIIGNRILTTRNSGNGINASGTSGIVANNHATGVAGTPFNITGSGIQRRNNTFSSGAKQGRAVLVAGTVTVSTGEVLANANISLTRVLAGGTAGHLSIGTIVANTSFVINSSSGTDTATVFWELVA